jgi:hypothetical protein
MANDTYLNLRMTLLKLAQGRRVGLIQLNDEDGRRE